MKKIVTLAVVSVLFSGCMSSKPKALSVEDLRAQYNNGTKVVKSPTGQKLYLEEFFKLPKDEQVIKAKKFKQEMIQDMFASMGGKKAPNDKTAITSEDITSSAKNVMLQNMPTFMQNQITGKKEEVVNKEKLRLSKESLNGIKKVDSVLLTSIKNQHHIGISKVAISSDNKLFATADHRAEVKIFDLENGKLLQSFTADDESIIYLKFLNSEKVLTATSKSVKLWSIQSGKELKVFNEISLEREMKLEKKKKEKKAWNEALYHYSEQSKKRQREIDAVTGIFSGTNQSIREEFDTVNENYINTLTTTEDMRKVLVSKSLGDIHIWDIETGKIVKVLEDKDMAYGLSYIGNNRCVSATKKGFIIRDINSGEEISRIEGKGMLTKIYSNQKYFVTYNKEHNYIRLFDNQTLKELGKITVPEHIQKIVFTNNSLILGAYNGTIYSWDLNVNSPLQTITKYSKSIRNLLFNSKKLIISTSSSIEAWQF